MKSLTEVPPAGTDVAVIRVLLDDACDPSWIASSDGEIIYGNYAWRSLSDRLRIYVAALQPDSSPLLSFLTGTQTDWCAAATAAKPFQTHFSVPAGETSLESFCVHVRPVFDGSGQVERWIGTAKPASLASERPYPSSLFEAGLGEIGHRLRALTDNLPSSMVYQIQMRSDGADRRFVYLSSSCEQVTGVPAAAAMANAALLIERIFAEDLPAFSRAEDAAIKSLTPFEIEVRFIRRGESEVRWCRLNSAPRRMSDGALIWDGLFLDVTQQRRSAEEFRQSEALKRAVVDVALDCVVTSDQDGRIVEWNPAAEQTFGVPRSEALGQDLTDLIVPPQFRQAHRRGFANYMKTGQGTLVGRRIEVHAIRSDGSEFPAELAIAPTFVGSTRLMTAYIRDITSRRQFEERQARLVAELNHRVKNALATVQAVADQTLRSSGGDPVLFAKPFMSRIMALSRAHDLLTREGWGAAKVQDVVRAALSPWLLEPSIEPRVRFSCDASLPHSLQPIQAQTLVLALHELATNAVKHGSLAGSGGHVDVVCQDEPGGTIRIDWKESGGSLTVTTPVRRGFGTRLLEKGLDRDLGKDASVRLFFEPSGLKAEIRFRPARELNPF